MPQTTTRERKDAPRATFTQVVGEIFVTVGVLVLLFAFYESFWTNLEAGRKQEVANAQLEDTWENRRGQGTPELGNAFARLYIPHFGSDFHFAIVEGTNEEQLLAGPGHYPETQGAGQAGNFALAGHRVGKGAPFNDLGALKTCDALVVETQTTWEIYRVLPTPGSGDLSCFSPDQQAHITGGDYAHVQGRYITTPSDVAVIDPLPHTEAAPEGLEALITLTTCHPQFSNAERMIVHGMLTESLPKEPGVVPTVLGGKNV